MTAEVFQQRVKEAEDFITKSVKKADPEMKIRLADVIAGIELAKSVNQGTKEET